MQSTINAIAQATLNRVENGRRLKAECGLADDTLRVEIVALHGNTGVDAIVRNGDSNTEYEVYLSEKVASCSCKDYEFRQQPCKHIAGASMFLLGSTTPTAKPCPFALGDFVQLRGFRRVGKVVCISCGIISVCWEPVLTEMKPGFTQAYNVVELEPALMPTLRHAA